MVTKTLVRLRALDRGTRLNEVGVPLSTSAIEFLMHTGVRTTGSLIELISLKPEEFAKEYGLSPSDFEKLGKVLVDDIGGDCVVDPKYRADLLAMDYPLDGNDGTETTDYETAAISADDLAKRLSVKDRQDFFSFQSCRQ